MDQAPGPGLSWQVRERTGSLWSKALVRTIARGEVTAPDGHSYIVRVIRILWPRTARILDDAAEAVPVDSVVALSGTASLLSSRVVWGVRVYRRTRRFGIRPLVYGEELRDSDAGVARGLEIAEALAAGRKP